MEQLFSIAGSLAMVGWAALILAPRHRTVVAATGLAVPALLSVPYAALVMSGFAEAAAGGGGYGSLAAVRALLSHEPMLLAGWIHYLAFDLAIGTVLALRMDAVRIGRIVQAPILLAVFLFGPLGFLAGLLAEGATRLLLSDRKALA